jgi:N-acetylneuraminate synthase
MSKVFFIAEIGINHNGDINIAKQLIDIAVESGCDAVKFQKRTIDVVYDKEMLDSPRESPWGNTQRVQKEGIEFGKEEYDEIDRYCKVNDIEWFASAWDEGSQDFLSQYDLKYNKIASAILTHIPLLKKVSSEGKHTFISTGLSTYDDIDRAVEIFKENDCPYTLLHCVSTYPTNDSDCNISVINTLRERYNCDIGYSGHEKGLIPSLLATINGATVIERHITLDKAMYGSDQAASVQHEALKRLIRDVNNIEKMLGDGVKRVLEDEVKIAEKLRYW